MTMNLSLPGKDMIYACPHQVIIIYVPFYFQKYPSGIINYICALFMGIVKRRKFIPGFSVYENKAK